MRFRLWTIFLVLFLVVAVGCKSSDDEKTAPQGTNDDCSGDSTTQIIADHSVVAQYDKIPQQWIDEVKKMWVNIAGESHSYGYRRGLELLRQADSTYAVSILESGTPEGYTSNNLRISRATWGDYTHTTGWRYSYGEEDFFTNSAALDQTKAHLTYANTTGFEIAAFGFGWCWDMTSGESSGGTEDSVFGVHWAGRTAGGPDGSHRFGLDAADESLTNNSVSMQTYLDAVETYSAYVKDNGYKTKILFTTGPVDGGSNDAEEGYQRYLKHEYIRDYVKADSTRILFDYADILTHNNSGEQNMITWNGNSFPFIHSDNLNDLDGNLHTVNGDNGDHIGDVGALRLGKAMWWLLARIAGWDGVSE